MAEQVGTLEGRIRLRTDRLRDDTRRASGMFRNLSNSGRMSARNMSAGFKAALVAITVALVKLGKELIEIASDAEETRNKFLTAFKGIEDKALATARTLAQAYKMSKLEAEKLLAGTGDLLKGFGFSSESALQLSFHVQALAADLASYNNLQGGTARASEILTKALLGERDSLVALGVKLSEADVKAKLLEMGMDKLEGQALLAAKAQATYALVLEQTGDAQGDIARSGESYANQMKEFKANVNDLAVALGKNLLPVANAVVKSFNNMFQFFEDRRINSLQSRLEALTEQQRRWNRELIGFKQKGLEQSVQIVLRNLDRVGTELKEVQDELKDAKKDAETVEIEPIEFELVANVDTIVSDTEESLKDAFKGFRLEPGLFEGFRTGFKEIFGKTPGEDIAEATIRGVSGAGGGGFAEAVGGTEPLRDFVQVVEQVNETSRDLDSELKEVEESAKKAAEANFRYSVATFGVEDAIKQFTGEIINSLPFVSEFTTGMKAARDREAERVTKLALGAGLGEEAAAEKGEEAAKSLSVLKTVASGAASVLSNMVQNSVSFSKFMEDISPSLESITDIIGNTLTPVFGILEITLETFARIIGWINDTVLVPVGNIFIDLFNAVADIIKTITFGAVKIGKLDAFRTTEELRELREETSKTTEAMSGLGNISDVGLAAIRQSTVTGSLSSSPRNRLPAGEHPMLAKRGPNQVIVQNVSLPNVQNGDQFVNQLLNRSVNKFGVLGG